MPKRKKTKLVPPDTTAEEDRAMLNLLPEGRVGLEERRRRAAIITRLGEKDLLRQVLETLAHLRIEASPSA